MLKNKRHILLNKKKKKKKKKYIYIYIYIVICFMFFKKWLRSPFYWRIVLLHCVCVVFFSFLCVVGLARNLTMFIYCNDDDDQDNDDDDNDDDYEENDNGNDTNNVNN